MWNPEGDQSQPCVPDPLAWAGFHSHALLIANDGWQGGPLKGPATASVGHTQAGAVLQHQARASRHGSSHADVTAEIAAVGREAHGEQLVLTCDDDGT